MNNSVLWIGVAGLGLYLLLRQAKANEETADGGAPDVPDMGAGGGGDGWYGDDGGSFDVIDGVGSDTDTKQKSGGGLSLPFVPNIKIDPDAGRDAWLDDSIGANQKRFGSLYQAGLAAFEAANKSDDSSRSIFKKKNLADDDDDDKFYVVPRLKVTPPKPDPIPQRLQTSAQVTPTLSPASSATVTRITTLPASKTAGQPHTPKSEPVRFVRTQIAPAYRPTPQRTTKPKTTALLRQITPVSSRVAVTRQAATVETPVMTSRKVSVTKTPVVRLFGGIR